MPGSAEKTSGDERTAALRNANACREMAALCGDVLRVAPDLTPREFLRTLGALVAGIDLGVGGFRQLARGGSNGLVGAGFRAEYDDGTAGQARHFAGIAAAAALVGEKPAEVLAHHVVDPAESIDGQLSTAAIEFAGLVLDGSLPLDQTGRWIEEHVCDPAFQVVDGMTPFDALGGDDSAERAIRERIPETTWRMLADLPELVTVAVALADPSGDFDDVREVVAGVREIEGGSDSESALVRAVIAQRYDDGFEFGADEADTAARIDRTLEAVHTALIDAKRAGVPTAELVAYARFLLQVGTRAARGSRSGGVLGIGGRSMSDAESAFLERLEEVLDASLPPCDSCLD